MHDLMKLVLEHQEELIGFRRYLHRHPELSFKENNTAAYIKEKLTEAGIPWTAAGETGVVGEITGEKPAEEKRSVVIRADTDALPIHEETGLEFSSEVDGVMHACGHDMHTAMLLMTGKLLNEMKSEFSGTVKLAFQPAEEMVSGAALMMRENDFMEGVDYAVSAHVMTNLPTGKIGFRKGGLFFGGERFQIYVEGRGGHGAQPHTAIDALLAGSAIVSNAQSMLARETDAFDAAVATICTFQAGTGACNVIAESAYMNGTTRFLSDARREALKNSLNRITEMTAQAFGCKGRVEWDNYAPAVENDADLDVLLRKSVAELLGNDAIEEAPRFTSSDDFSWFQKKTKGYYMILGCGTGDEAHSSPHTPQFIPDENCLPIGVASFIKIALDLLA